MRRLAPALALVLCLLPTASSAAKKQLGFADLMAFRRIQDVRISDGGEWAAWELAPDRGDGEGVLRSTDGRKVWRQERGADPRLSRDGAWCAFVVRAPFAEREKARLDDSMDEPQDGAVLVRGVDGERWSWERVDSFDFSGDGSHLVLLHAAEEAAEGDSAQVHGALLRLVDLAGPAEREIAHVADYALSPEGAWLAYATAAPDSEAVHLVVEDLTGQAPPDTLRSVVGGGFRSLTWAEEASRLALVAGRLEDEELVEPRILLFDPQEGVREVPAPAGRAAAAENRLVFTRDGARLFLDLVDAPAQEGPAEADSTAEAPFDPYDLEAILADREVEVWHWDDPRIKPHEKKAWEEEKDRGWRAVLHVDRMEVVPLGGEDLPRVRIAQNPRRALGLDETPWRKVMTWEGFFNDVYLVDLATGERTLVATRSQDDRSLSLSPGGRWLTWFQGGHWHLFDAQSGARRNLTEDMDTPFADEDHDYPSPAPGYGLAGWLADDAGVILYDKYDLWLFPTDGGSPRRLTRGREEERTYRFVDLDPDEEAIDPREPLLLSGFHQKRKNSSYHRLRLDDGSLETLREAEKAFTFVAKAEDADRMLHTEERYDEFPDLWISDTGLDGNRRLSRANPEMDDFAWGEAELVQWRSLDGEPLQGVLIKPADYQEGRRYPVLVYYYRFMSQRLHRFNEPVVNHRPSFPVYAGDGYCVFLPDVRFEVGRPGLSTVKCLVPGVQKLVEMGVADPEAVGLHGHSWSGYTSAFVLTRTDIFAACVSGAPVSNMTSAYSGIRWGSGLARQFQYEQSQSRLGASLWESPQLYWLNSTVFFADRIHTPLLIMHGDEDEAVPWQQSIELYLAMRRLGKPCVFLRYRGEPHHLKKDANQLDYSMKMKAFFDHFLKGEEAPDWWSDGVPWSGD